MVKYIIIIVSVSCLTQDAEDMIKIFFMYRKGKKRD
jgi:hypothetical protein